MSTRFNLSNSWLRLKDQDYYIEKKLWRLTHNQPNIEGLIEKNNIQFKKKSTQRKENSNKKWGDDINLT